MAKPKPSLEELKASEWADLRVLALHAVTKQPPDYVLRKIFRKYSKDFHTPLHLVGDLPLVDVMCHFYESMYESMEDEDLEKEQRELLESPEERAERLKHESLREFTEAESLRLVMSEAALEDKRMKKAAEAKKLEDLKAQTEKPLEKFEPGISMTFVGDAAFEALLAKDEDV